MHLFHEFMTARFILFLIMPIIISMMAINRIFLYATKQGQSRNLVNKPFKLSYYYHERRDLPDN